MLLFLTGSATAALLNRFSFIPSPFCSALLNDPCQEVDASLEQNKIKLIFPVVLNLFYSIETISPIPRWSSKACSGTQVELPSLTHAQSGVSTWVSRFACFYICQKAEGAQDIFPHSWDCRGTSACMRSVQMCCWLHPAAAAGGQQQHLSLRACFLPPHSDRGLQIEGNPALNLGAGDGDGKSLLKHSVHFPDKADLSSVVPTASSVLCISQCFCCPGLFQRGMNQALYLVINKKNLTVLWFSCTSCCRKY